MSIPSAERDTVPADLAAALADRYELRAAIGRGGMATVYLATDRKHHREVAVKVLRPDIANTIGADRFLAEIQIVARMVHPHVLSLHDSGTAEGFIYYVMPFIDGGSLRDVMERNRPIGVRRAIDIAIPIADALTYAHSLGVLHRDIKPENVLFAREHPIVADFGIAKAVSSASGAQHLTRTGISLGTPGYMSPEQAAGFADIDSRTDVYSLAVLVYEMITGEIPGRWVSEESTRTGRFVDAAPTHRPVLSAAGATVEGALVRALALRPDQRTATPHALIDDITGRAGAGRRKYRPDEIDEIVKRAAEIEASNPTMSGSMTIGGVEEIAREVGIDPAHIRSAASALVPVASGSRRSLTPLQTPRKSLLAGAPTRLLFERVVEGELSDTDFEALVEEIRVSMDQVGQVSQLGRSFSWVTRGPGTRRDLEVAVSVREGRTRITIAENLGNLAGAIFGGIVGGAGGGGMGPIIGIAAKTLHDPAVGMLMVPFWLITVFSFARFTYASQVAKRGNTLESLADRLADLTRDLVGPKRLK